MIHKNLQLTQGMPHQSNSQFLKQSKGSWTGKYPSNFLYTNKPGKIACPTANNGTKYIRKIAKECKPHLHDYELSLYLCHSLIVWTAVLLHEVGQIRHYIKTQLRWESNSCGIYHRDTKNAANTQNKELTKNSNAICFILKSNHTNHCWRLWHGWIRWPWVIIYWQNAMTLWKPAI